MNKGDKDYLDSQMDNIFIKMGLEFSKFSKSVELKLRDMDAGQSITHIKMDEIIEHQKVANHRGLKLEENTIKVPPNKRLKVTCVFIAAMFIISLIGATAYHGINWIKTFENKTKIELNEHL